MDPISPLGTVSSIRAPLQVPVARQCAPLFLSSTVRELGVRTSQVKNKELVVGRAKEKEGEGKIRKLKCCCSIC